MNKHTSYNWRRQLMWGLLLIAIGAAIFADQMGLFDIDEIWHYWPLLLVLAGINKMIGFPTAKHFTDGLWLAFLGAWLFAVFEDLFGLTFRNSWPLLIIAGGVSMVLQPLIAKRFESNTESGNEK